MGASAFERLPPVLPRAGVVGRCEDGPGRAGGDERGSAAAHPKGKQRLACGSEESVHGTRSRTVLREEARPLDETLAREMEGLRKLRRKRCEPVTRSYSARRRAPGIKRICTAGWRGGCKRRRSAG